VSIGEGTRVGSLAVIKSGTRVGRHCDIKSGAVIGETGFGFERDGANRPLRMIHFGRVVIGDHVEIGSLTTVCRGALGDTVLEDHVKIDDHCHISHNSPRRRGGDDHRGGRDCGSVRSAGTPGSRPCAPCRRSLVGAEAFIGIGVSRRALRCRPGPACARQPRAAHP
jgi:UDP-3-O-[3-hydroxymyristoyl] glucosamine N-acyltransferase